jgi:hypothetical protein
MVNRNRDLLRFRIELLDIEPAIQREILVPARYTLWDLHVAIQGAMGWQDCHLHEFHVSTADGDFVLGILLDDSGADTRDQLIDWEYAVVDRVHAPGKGMDPPR